MNEYQVFQSGPRAGQPKTLTDRVVRFLVEGLKRQELPSKSKYRKFTGSKPDSFWWVGNVGAVWAGKSASGSVSLTAQIRSYMKAWERKEGK